MTRITGVSINTVTKLLVDAGKACSDYQDKAFRNLTCKRIQVDEIWAFVYAKAKNVADAKAAPEAGWRHLDMDRDRRGYQADPVMAGRGHVTPRPRSTSSAIWRAARQSGATDQ